MKTKFFLLLAISAINCFGSTLIGMQEEEEPMVSLGSYVANKLDAKIIEKYENIYGVIITDQRLVTILFKNFEQFGLRGRYEDLAPNRVPGFIPIELIDSKKEEELLELTIHGIECSFICKNKASSNTFQLPFERERDDILKNSVCSYSQMKEIRRPEINTWVILEKNDMLDETSEIIYPKTLLQKIKEWLFSNPHKKELELCEWFLIKKNNTPQQKEADEN